MKGSAMSIKRLGLALLLLLGTFSYAAAEDQPAEPEAAGAPQWAEFKSDAQGFVVSFPGAPKTTSAPVGGQNPLVQHDFQVSVGTDAVYTVVVFEYPAGKAPTPDTNYYLKIGNAYAKGSETKLRKRGPTTIAERPGFELIADDGKNKLTHMVDIVPEGDRIYMVVSAVPRGRDASDAAERFRDSFRLLGETSKSASDSSAQ